MIMGCQFEQMMSMPPTNADLKQLPLDYYHCTFFFPLVPALGQGLPPEPDTHPEYLYGVAGQEAPCEAQAYHFFTPILRGILFNRGQQVPLGLEPIREWRLPEALIQPWRLTLKALPPVPPAEGRQPGYAVPDKTVCFSSVRLFRYFNGLYLLAYTVTPAVGQGMALEDWLHFTRLGRQLYPSFTEQGDENKIARLILRKSSNDPSPIEAFKDRMPLKLPPLEQPGADLSPILLEVLKQFFSPARQADFSLWLRDSIALYDDRMFVSVAYGLQAPPEPQALHKLHTLVAFTDRLADCWVGEDNYPYTREATDRYLQGKCFDLWKDAGSSYFYTDKVNAYVSGGEFFRETIAPCHIPVLYDRMLALALFYQASLRHYDQKITHTTQLLLAHRNRPELIRQQREDFIRFTNQYWFQELTEQMQGKEICRLQQQGLGLQEHYGRILDEISRTDEYLHAQKEANATRLSNRLTFWGAAFALVALYFALLPVLNDVTKDFNTGKLSFWQIVQRCLVSGGIPDDWAGWVAGGAFLAFIPAVLIVVAFLRNDRDGRG